MVSSLAATELLSSSMMGKVLPPWSFHSSCDNEGANPAGIPGGTFCVADNILFELLSCIESFDSKVFT